MVIGFGFVLCIADDVNVPCYKESGGKQVTMTLFCQPAALSMRNFCLCLCRLKTISSFGGNPLEHERSKDWSFLSWLSCKEYVTHGQALDPGRASGKRQM